MKRREFIALAAATAFVPLGARAAEPLTYTEGLVAERLAAGDTVFVDFYTDWCSTCRAQRRSIAALLEENPEYDKNIVFINVDWDIHSGSTVSKKYDIRRRSTLLVLKGDEELGRIVADTSRSAIKELMDKGLAAATA